MTIQTTPDPVMVCEICGAEVKQGEDFRTLSSATFNQEDKPHPKTRIVRAVKDIKRWVWLHICNRPDCLTQALERLR